MTRTARWCFELISPYACLQLMHFERLPGELEPTLRPVLFAALLGHREHKGPAEIPARRVQTCRHCHWLAERLGIPFRAPPAHPFDPLPLPRLAIAPGATRDHGPRGHPGSGRAHLPVRLGRGGGRCTPGPASRSWPPGRVWR